MSAERTLLVSDAVPVVGELPRRAQTGWRCVFCGETTEAIDVPVRCCPNMFAVRLSTLRKP